MVGADEHRGGAAIEFNTWEVRVMREGRRAVPGLLWLRHPELDALETTHIRVRRLL